MNSTVETLTAVNPREETLMVLDSMGRIVGWRSREDVHKNGNIHDESGVFVSNEKTGEILLQQRQDNGMFSISAGEHVKIYENPPESSQRGLKEELGYNELVELRFRFKIFFEENNNKCFISVYSIEGDFKIEDFKIQKEEILDIKFFTRDQIKEMLEEDNNYPVQIEERTKVLLRELFKKI